MSTIPAANGSSPRKRIAVVLSGQPTDGGKYQYAITVLRSLEESNAGQWELAAFVVGQPGWKERLAADRWHIVDVHRSIPGRMLRRAVLALPRGLQLWRALSMQCDPLGRALASYDPDLVLFLNNERFAYELPVPSVMPVHDLMHRYESRFPEVGDAAELRFRERHYRALARYCKGFLVDSTVGRTHLMESYGVDEARVHVLPFIAPMHLATLEPVPVTAGGRELPARFMFYPAQFWQHKNHEGLINAAALLRDRGTIVPLVFCGAGKNAQAGMDALITGKRLGDQIIMIDYVSDAQLSWLYKHAAALIMPTFFGPTNIPPLEAHMLGCPVLVSGIYGMPEQLGDAALYFDPRDPESIANAMERVWSDPAVAADLVSKGMARHASWNAVHHAARVKMIFAEIAGG
jgi:glycosyltransferase involved in cell wall biosynthesis